MAWLCASLSRVVLHCTGCFADAADIGLEEARRKGTNRKVVRTDPRITHNKFEPPWVRLPVLVLR